MLPRKWRGFAARVIPPLHHFQAPAEQSWRGNPLRLYLFPVPERRHSYSGRFSFKFIFDFYWRPPIDRSEVKSHERGAVIICKTSRPGAARKFFFRICIIMVSDPDVTSFCLSAGPCVVGNKYKILGDHFPLLETLARILSSSST